LKKEANSSKAELRDKQKDNNISKTAWETAQRGDQELDSLKRLVVLKSRRTKFLSLA